MRFQHRRPVAIVVAGLLAAACGGGSGDGGDATPTPRAAKRQSPAPATGPAAGGGTTVGVSAVGSGAPRFSTRTLRARAGGVTFEFDNPSDVPHAFAVEGHGLDRSTRVVTGRRAALSVRLEPGRYTFYCPVGGHREAGMEGVLSVSG
jgi:plastocyanin